MSDTFVCPDCVDDYALQAFIQTQAKETTCSYCGKVSANGQPIAAPFEPVAERIRNTIEKYYEDPVQNVGYCSAEGGYLLPTMTTWELMSEVGLDGSEEEFLEHLTDGFDDHDWVKQDPYGDWEDDSLRYSWKDFSEQVMHQTRFVFFKVAKSTYPSHEPEPYQILDAVGEIATNLGMFRFIPQQTELFRARLHDSAKTYNDAAGLGSPPKERASQSRMSPAGIPMFYGAEDEDTAFKETFGNDPKKTLVTFGCFHPLRPLLLLDLTSIPPVPSVFDLPMEKHRFAISFMRSFEKSATAPIPHDGSESHHYKYVPTQVVAEYFRHVFKHPNGDKVDGILFNSSRNGRKCYTLFADCKQCTDCKTASDKMVCLTSFRTAKINFATQSFS